MLGLVLGVLLGWYTYKIYPSVSYSKLALARAGWALYDKGHAPEIFEESDQQIFSTLFSPFLPFLYATGKKRQVGAENADDPKIVPIYVEDESGRIRRSSTSPQAAAAGHHPYPSEALLDAAIFYSFVQQEMKKEQYTYGGVEEACAYQKNRPLALMERTDVDQYLLQFSESQQQKKSQKDSYKEAA